MTYYLPHDINIFGFQVTSFPMGIGEAFDKLMKNFPAEDKRSYYGISVCTSEGVIYKACAEEKYAGEGEKYGYETYIIQQGEYLAEAIANWQQKTACIKDVFAEMMKDERVNNILPCICVEWYKNMEEMLCMIKLEKQKTL